MTKLIYNGVMATGFYKAKNFGVAVKKGEEYEIPEELVEEFLNSGDWIRNSPVKKEKKKEEIIEEVPQIEEEVSDYDELEEDIDGGNKKW